jgi:hypothetical protein
MRGMRTMAVDPVQKHVSGPSIGIGVHPAVTMLDSPVQNGVSGRHGYALVGFAAKVVLDWPWLADGMATDFEGPREAVAVSEGQRQAMFAGLAIRVHPADIARTVKAEVVVRGQERAPGHVAHGWRQSPEKLEHRRIVLRVDVDRGFSDDGGVRDEAAGQVRKVSLDPREEGGSHLWGNQALDRGVALDGIVAGYLHGLVR